MARQVADAVSARYAQWAVDGAADDRLLCSLPCPARHGRGCWNPSEIGPGCRWPWPLMGVGWAGREVVFLPFPSICLAKLCLPIN